MGEAHANPFSTQFRGKRPEHGIEFKHQTAIEPNAEAKKRIEAAAAEKLDPPVLTNDDLDVVVYGATVVIKTTIQGPNGFPAYVEPVGEILRRPLATLLATADEKLSAEAPCLVSMP